MSWSRFDDRWVDRVVWESVDLASRWHYLCLVQSCSRNGRFDGVMPLPHALRASDVESPAECHQVLEAHGLIEVIDGQVRVVEIDLHVPPPSIRENAAQSKIRMARHRKHKNGDHSDCLPETCPAAPVTEVVTRNTGTGRDGLLREPGPASDVTVTRNNEPAREQWQETQSVNDSLHERSNESLNESHIERDRTGLANKTERGDIGFTSTQPKCPHGMVNGDRPDPFVGGRMACPECASRVVAS